jgi:hypothetical protein
MSVFEGGHAAPRRTSRTKGLILYQGAHAQTKFVAIASSPVGEINLRKEGAQCRDRVLCVKTWVFGEGEAMEMKIGY